MNSKEYELEDITLPDIPQRSRLYNLEPVGLGTSFVESLSGYAARLAEKYSTTLYYLFSREITPLINKPGTISHRVSFASFAKATNGVGIIAADLVDVFERLTLRYDLRFTTMLPWSRVISSKSLTRQFRAWCPTCYETSVASENEVYDQLLWSIQSVSVCSKHKRRLEHECPHCGQRQLPLSHRIRAGFCGRCHGWLGNHQDDEDQAKELEIGTGIEKDLRVAEEVGKLFTVATTLRPSNITQNFAANLKVYVGKLFMGRGVPSKFELPVDKQTIRCWLRGTQIPSLPLLLKTCLALQLSPIQLFSDDNSRGANRVNEMPSEDEPIAGHPRRNIKDTICLPINWKNAESVAQVERRLHSALGESPPSSITKLAKELKCTKATLRKKFPELAAQIAEKASAYYRPSIDIERISKVIRAASKEHPPPPLEEVSRRLGAGASNAILHKKFPRESRKIVERYRAHNKRRLDDNNIEKQLRAVLERTTPPSMPEVSIELGVARATLYHKFPDLYKAASNRFAAYRRERNERNRELARAEIKSICERALREGIYPSCALVLSQLSVPCQSEVFSKTRREVLAEINSRSPDLMKKHHH